MAFGIEGDHRVHAGEAHEGPTTAYIEKHTSKVESGIFLAAAGASIIASLGFKIARKDTYALFVGQWVAPFMLLGMYNKMIKQHGSDAESR